MSTIFKQQFQNFACEISTAKRIAIFDQNMAKFTSFLKSSCFQQMREYKQDEFKNDVSTLDDVKRVLGSQWRNRLKVTYKGLKYLCFIAPKNYILERPISCQNPVLVDHCGSVKKVKTVLRNLQLLDCLKRTSDKHWSGKFFSGEYGELVPSKMSNICYVYIINRKCCFTLAKLCEELFGKLEWKHAQETYEIDINDLSQTVTEKDVAKMVKKARFGSKLGIDITKFADKKDTRRFEEIATASLLQRYPMLAEYVAKRKTLNQYFTGHERAMGNYRVSFHYSASGCHCTKIGIRDWNDFCSLKSHDKTELVRNGDNFFFKTVLGSTKYTGKRFKSELRSEFNWTNVFEYDVKSSVPRVLWLLRHGEWLDDSVDVYERILGAKFLSPVHRKCFKGFVLKALFSTPQELVNSVKQHYTDVEWKHMGYIKSLCGADYTSPVDFCNWLSERLYQLFGDIDGTAVFMHESNLYMDVEEELQKRNIQYVKKFDCFYTNVEVSDLKDIIKAKAMQYHQRWFGSVGKNKRGEIERVVETVNVPTLPQHSRFDDSGMGFHMVDPRITVEDPRQYREKEDEWLKRDYL